MGGGIPCVYQTGKRRLPLTEEAGKLATSGTNRGSCLTCRSAAADRFSNLAADEGLGVPHSSKPSWRPVTTGVPQRFILGPIPFNSFINEMNLEAKFADDTKLSKGLMKWNIVLSFRGTTTRWRDGPVGTSQSSTTESTEGK